MERVIFLSVEVGEIEVALEAGQGVQITPGETHRVHNRPPRDTDFLVISNPPSHRDRVLADSSVSV